MSFSLMLALAAATPTQAGEPKQGSLQQDFDAASAAALSGDCAKAIPLFEALERRVKPGSLPAAAVASRKGQCLVKTGRTAEGEDAILAGLPGLERAGAEFTLDVAESYAHLGNVSLFSWDYVQAKERYLKALGLLNGPGRLVTLAGLLKATAFDDGLEPLQYAEEGIRLAASQEKPSKDLLATFHTLKGRILLNRGQNDEAYATLKEALSLSGGLTYKASLSEASLRSDVALAALLLGRKDDARKYLAYTGAGRIAESPFAKAVSMSPPDCGAETGLRPDDFAVVEFVIADDGSVSIAQTVHSRGGPRVAAAFARAVSEWYWQPEAIAKIPPFYRLATRVELRCSTAGGPSPGVLKPLSDRFAQWASAQRGGSKFDTGTSSAEIVVVLRQHLAEREKASDAAGQIAAIGMLVIVDPRTNAETVALLDRAIALTGNISAPAETANALRIFRLLSMPYAKVKGRNARTARLDWNSMLTLGREPTIEADPLAAATIRLLAPSTEPALLRQVADDSRLAAHHPLRQLALLKLADQAASSGDLAAAQSFFARTGLTEQQCALIGARPAMKSSGASASDFPREAMEYGFEGWVNLEFDITAEGRTANARPVIAYPPFVFVDAAKGMTRDISYEASYRPSGGVACSANRQTISFVLPFLRS